MGLHCRSMEVFLYSETDINDKWIPINLAARMLGLSGPGIRKWIAEGKVRCITKAEDTPRLGTQCRPIKHVSWMDLTRLHQRLSSGRKHAQKDEVMECFKAAGDHIP
jgi:hypothetical protein